MRSGKWDNGGNGSTPAHGEKGEPSAPNVL
jgi:hypothetical protein